MRQGNDPRIIVGEDGRIIGIATGSDFCTEHECGSKKLQQALTLQNDCLDEQLVLKLRKRLQNEATLLGRVENRLLPRIDMPDIMDRKRICRNLEEIELIEKKGEKPEAMLGYSPYGGGIARFKGELAFPSHDENRADIAGAWDEKSFAFRARGHEKVAMLRDLHQQLQNGKAFFAGTFAEYDGKERLAGVIVMIGDRLRQEYRAAIGKAQKEYESDLRLKAASRVDSLQKLIREKKLGHLGHFSPRWKDEAESEAVYWFNSWQEAKAACGTYSYGELESWLKAGCTYYLGRKAD